MLDELADVMSPDHNGTWLRTRSGAIEMSPIASKIQACVTDAALLRQPPATPRSRPAGLA
jgi:hypothetical protein